MRQLALIPICATLAATAPAAQAQEVFGTLADPPPVSLETGAKMPLPIEPQFAEPDTKTFAAMLVDLQTRPGPHLMVFKAGEDTKQALPEEPKPE